VGVSLLAAVPAAIIAGLLSPWTAFWPVMWWIIISCVVIVSSRFGYKWWRSYRKTIRDYPNPGDVRTHTAAWKGENFDRLLSKYVNFARAANAIDETRKDFDRVAWGGPEGGEPLKVVGQPEKFVQFWFAGNHSDVGGSYDNTVHPVRYCA
jgi:hypothetical protein